MADGPKNVKSRIIPLVPKFVYSSGRWVAKLVARHLTAAALWVRIQTALKNLKNGRHNLSNTQHTLQKNMQKNNLAFFLSVQVKMRAKPVSRKVSQQEEINKRLSLPADLRYRIFVHKTLHLYLADLFL
jgi:hypothetical protein